MKISPFLLSTGLALGITACVTAPTLSTLPVMPPPGKAFARFAAEQDVCQRYANLQTAPVAQDANNKAIASALLTTALGAGLGAAVGAGGWHTGRAAGIGAASGAVAGTAIGATQTSFAQLTLQQQFDVLYGQCMVAHGNLIPGFTAPPGAPRFSGIAGLS